MLALFGGFFALLALRLLSVAAALLAIYAGGPLCLFVNGFLTYYLNFGLVPIVATIYALTLLLKARKQKVEKRGGGKS